jgi:hypothetical protein
MQPKHFWGLGDNSKNESFVVQRSRILWSVECIPVFYRILCLNTSHKSKIDRFRSNGQNIQSIFFGVRIPFPLSAYKRSIAFRMEVFKQRHRAWGIQGGSKTVAGRSPCRRRPLNWLQGRFRGGRQQDVEVLGMVSPSDTLESPWIPPAIRPCFLNRVEWFCFSFC